MRKATSDFLQVITLTSPERRYDTVSGKGYRPRIVRLHGAAEHMRNQPRKNDFVLRYGVRRGGIDG